ncbi:MAG: RNA polymerase principal sigma factor HrdA [Firmicutes bacterium ADurb.Bin419]|nr:MAG: RNA polymerase principal sigma factor HrdA [Firmicutes bacterium ADurb.Bin419]
MSNEEIVKRYNSGDTMALSELTENNLDLIKFVANKFTIYCNYISFDDLIQEGWTGLLRAAETYKPDLPNSAKFSTWAVYWIRQAIQRHLEKSKQEQSIHEEKGEGFKLLDSLEDTDAATEIEARLWQYDLRKELEEVISKHLSLKQQEVIKLYYGWTNKVRFTFKEIGEVLGLTSINARHIHDSSMSKLRVTTWARLRYKEHYLQQRIRFEYSNPEASIKYMVPQTHL